MILRREFCKEEFTMKQAKGLWFVLILILILIVSFGFSGCSASDQPSGEGESLPGILA